MRPFRTRPNDPKARLVFTPFEAQETVRGIDLFAAQQIADSFGILDTKVFDFLLVRATAGRAPTVTQ